MELRIHFSTTILFSVYQNHKEMPTTSYKDNFEKYLQYAKHSDLLHTYIHTDGNCQTTRQT